MSDEVLISTHVFESDQYLTQQTVPLCVSSIHAHELSMLMLVVVFCSAAPPNTHPTTELKVERATSSLRW
jgi:hypothetical protein